MDRVREARWRIEHGFYDLSDVIEEMVDRLLEDLAGSESAEDGTGDN